VHFYCECCHRTFCLNETPIPGVPLPTGYVSRSINYMIKGLCPDCSEK
jgi:Fur family ferric uptake transcriptional regulator